ncbi:hypothetical protein BMR07_09465, partial [Methylococcaceae bacterium CS1]
MYFSYSIIGKLQLLINIIFFFWEYRKGAPEVYLPPVIEYAKNNAQKIFLIDKPTDVQQDKIKSINSDLRQAVAKAEKQQSTINIGEGMEINVSKECARNNFLKQPSLNN